MTDETPRCELGWDTREDIMRHWDSWRRYIANGGKASWPRDAFESLLDYYDERLAERAPPAVVAALVEALEDLLREFNFASEFADVSEEAAAARAALALHREAGR